MIVFHWLWLTVRFVVDVCGVAFILGAIVFSIAASGSASLQAEREREGEG